MSSNTKTILNVNNNIEFKFAPSLSKNDFQSFSDIPVQNNNFIDFYLGT